MRGADAAVCEGDACVLPEAVEPTDVDDASTRINPADVEEKPQTSK